MDLDSDDASQDKEIEIALQGAVSHAETYTAIPLIDVSDTVEVCPMGNELPIQLRTRDVKEVKSIKYWLPEQPAREAPAGEIVIAGRDTLGRIDEKLAPMGWVTEIWPPEDGWPTRSSEIPLLRLTCVYGFDLAGQGDSIRNAIILITRHLFEQPDMEDLPMAAATLLDPYVRFNG